MKHNSINLYKANTHALTLAYVPIYEIVRIPFVLILAFCVHFRNTKVQNQQHYIVLVHTLYGQYQKFVFMLVQIC